MKNRARALAVIIAILLAGCLLGIAGLHFWERGFRGRDAIPSTARGQGQTERLAKRLQLTPEQEAQLKAILEDSRRRINGSRAELEQKMETIRVQTNEKIAAILNDGQRKEFQRLLSEADAPRAAEPQPKRTHRRGAENAEK